MSYAFWTTKRQPWVTGEQIVAIKGNRVLTVSLEALVPVFITSDEEGVQIIDKLVDLDKRYRAAMDELTEQFRQEVDLLVPKESLPEYMTKLERAKTDLDAEQSEVILGRTWKNDV